MGASKKSGRSKRRQGQNTQNVKALNSVKDKNGYFTGTAVPETGPLPRCVSQLLKSSNYGELFESCSDLGFYATNAKHFSSLFLAGVPQRLAVLLSRLPLDPSASLPATAMPLDDESKTSEGVLSKLHLAIIQYQIAAAEALRNFITNSCSDEVMDALTSQKYVEAEGQGMTYSAILLSQVFGCWSLIKEVHSWLMMENIVLSVCTAGGEDEEVGDVEMEVEAAPPIHESARKERQARRAIRMYFSLLQLQEQLYQLALVSIDGSEEVANDFSQPRVAAEILRQLEVCMKETEQIMSRVPSVFSTDGSAEGTAEPRGGFSFFRREALLLTNLLAAGGDMLQTLSTDNTLLASCFSDLEADSELGVTVVQMSWMNSIAQGAYSSPWVCSQTPQIPLQSFPTPTVHTAPDSCASQDPERSSCNYQEYLLELEKDFIHLQVLRFTLSIQGTLLNLFPSGNNISQVLPLCVQVLSVFMPIQQWRQALPLLEDSCKLPEEIRNMVVRITTNRLRAAKTAIEVLHGCVVFIGEQNEDHLEDEAAFAKNPLSLLLYQSNTLHVLGCVLKDALWMVESAEEVTTDALRQTEQRALRLAAASNSEVTVIQFVILATEVGVWQLGSTLLLMVSPASLGELSVIWRAMLAAVHHRTELLSNAAAHAVITESVSGTEAYASAAEVYTIASASPAARHMLWLQLKSLTQILWTLARKQSALQQSYLDCTNNLRAEPQDLDLLTRLVWEKDCPYSVSQACVATVGFLAASFQQKSSVHAAACSAQALLTRAGGPFSLADLEERVIKTNPPTDLRERHVWLSRLQRVDEVVSVRSEAANTLMDLFSDERYDTEVYLPLRIQQSLQVFFQQLCQHITAREQLGKSFWKNYRVHLAPPSGFSLWIEVKDNLEGFLSYKKAHAHA